MVKRRLSGEDRERIRDAVVRAEARTGAELVVAVADSCGSYGVFGILWAALAALLAGAVTVLTAPGIGASRLMLVEGAVFAFLAAALAFPPLLMCVVPPSVRRAHARATAEQEFAALVGGRTEGNVGVLFFIALAERHVFILPDRGIAAAIDSARWEEIVTQLTEKAHHGALAAAIITAIDSAAALLEPVFPPEMPPENPLSDEVVEVGRKSPPPPNV